MDNFEYSIQLNDRDWAEFYLASEECSLIQAALATSEEPLPSDLEDRDVENRLIRVRVGPGLTPNSASCLLQGAPRGHLLAEEVLSGSEDEADLGSVSRFLCNNSRRSPAFPQPAEIQGSQPSHVALDPLGGQHELPELAREGDVSRAAGGRESETGDRLTDCFLPKVDLAVQKAEFPGQISELGAMEKPVCSVLMNAGDSKGIDGQAREHESRPPGVALQQPTNGISQTGTDDVQFPLTVGSKAVCGNPESLEQKDLNVHPTSSGFPSEGTEHPESGTKDLQAEAPSTQEKPSLFQGPSVPPSGISAPSDPLSESHTEGVVASRGNEEEMAADLIAEGHADQSKELVDSLLKEEGHVSQEIRSAGCEVNLVPEEPEASKCPQLTIVMDSRCSGTLDQHRDAAGVKAESQQDGAEEPCYHLRPTVPFEGESPRTAQGTQRANFLEDNIPYCLALEDSLEDPSVVTTRPQDDDCFLGGNTREQAEKMRDSMAEKRLASDVGQDLPEMYGPEMYEYFFIDMDKDLESARTSSSDQLLLAPSAGSPDSDSIRGDEATYISVPEVYEHFFNNGAQGRKNWKQLFFSMPASEAKKAVRALKSLLSKPAHLLRGHPSSPGAPLRRGSRGELVVFSPRLPEESQPRPEDLRMAVMSPERPLQLALTHRDVCLGFVAFASWAVKTSNLQAPDAWKIVLLANFGTLSAIRYFRRQIMAEGEQGT